MRRAGTLGESAKSFDSVGFLQQVQEAIGRNDFLTAESLLATAETKLLEIESGSSTSPTAIEERDAKPDSRPFPKRLADAIQKHSFAFDLILLTTVGLIEAGVLAWIQLQDYLSYNVLPDSATFNQVLFSTTHSSSFLHYTSNLPGGNNGQYLSVHFTPFLFALVPIYYFFTGIPTLLVIKQVALALGVLPAYALARFKLGSRQWAWLVAVVYLSTPLITGMDWANFDMESFLPVTLLTTFYFFETGRFRWFIVACIVSLSVIESVAPMIAIFAVVALVVTLFPRARRSEEGNRQIRKFAGWALVAAVVSFGIAYIFLTVLFPSPGGGSLGSSFAANFSVLGAKSIPDIPLRVVLHPGSAGAAISFDGNMKLVYILLLFGCVGFLPFFGELRYLVPVLGWIGISVLSNGPFYFAFSGHTLAYPAPFLIAGSVTGIQRILRYGPRIMPRLTAIRKILPRWKSPWNPYAVGSVLVAGLLVTVAVSSPWDSQPLGVPTGYPKGFDVPSAEDGYLSKVISFLPPSASVLTTRAIFPMVSSHPAAFVEPIGSAGFLPNWTGNNPGNVGGNLAYTRVTHWYLNMSQFVLLDFKLDQTAAISVLYFGSNLTGYGVRASDVGAVLYERGWTGAPQLWVPERAHVLVHENTTNVLAYTTAGLTGLPTGLYAATLWWDVNASASNGTVTATVKEIPSWFNTTSRYDTPSLYKYNLNLKTSGQLGLLNRSTLPAVGTMLFQVSFAGSISFAITDHPKGVTPVLYAVVLTQVMP
ncbi:MAG: DUF2079 domain-containing protein [Thermoplasmata archaeon]